MSSSKQQLLIQRGFTSPDTRPVATGEEEKRASGLPGQDLAASGCLIRDIMNSIFEVKRRGRNTDQKEEQSELEAEPGLDEPTLEVPLLRVGVLAWVVLAHIDEVDGGPVAALGLGELGHQVELVELPPALVGVLQPQLLPLVGHVLRSHREPLRRGGRGGLALQRFPLEGGQLERVLQQPVAAPLPVLLPVAGHLLEKPLALRLRPLLHRLPDVLALLARNQVALVLHLQRTQPLQQSPLLLLILHLAGGAFGEPRGLPVEALLAGVDKLADGAETGLRERTELLRRQEVVLLGQLAQHLRLLQRAQTALLGLGVLTGLSLEPVGGDALATASGPASLGVVTADILHEVAEGLLGALAVLLVVLLDHGDALLDGSDLRFDPAFGLPMFFSLLLQFQSQQFLLPFLLLVEGEEPLLLARLLASRVHGYNIIKIIQQSNYHSRSSPSSQWYFTSMLSLHSPVNENSPFTCIVPPPHFRSSAHSPSQMQQSVSRIPKPSFFPSTISPSYALPPSSTNQEQYSLRQCFSLPFRSIALSAFPSTSLFFCQQQCSRMPLFSHSGFWLSSMGPRKTPSVWGESGLKRPMKMTSLGNLTLPRPILLFLLQKPSKDLPSGQMQRPWPSLNPFRSSPWQISPEVKMQVPQPSMQLPAHSPKQKSLELNRYSPFPSFLPSAISPKQIDPFSYPSRLQLLFMWMLLSTSMIFSSQRLCGRYYQSPRYLRIFMFVFGIYVDSDRMAFRLSLSLLLEKRWYCLPSWESFEEFLASLMFFFPFPASQLSLLRSERLRGQFSSLTRLDLWSVKERLLSSSLDLLEDCEKMLQLRRLMWLCLMGVSDSYSLTSVLFFFLLLRTLVLDSVSTFLALAVASCGRQTFQISSISTLSPLITFRTSSPSPFWLYRLQKQSSRNWRCSWCSRYPLNSQFRSFRFRLPRCSTSRKMRKMTAIFEGLATSASFSLQRARALMPSRSSWLKQQFSNSLGFSRTMARAGRIQLSWQYSSSPLCTRRHSSITSSCPSPSACSSFLSTSNRHCSTDPHLSTHRRISPSCCPFPMSPESGSPWSGKRKVAVSAVVCLKTGQSGFLEDTS